MSERLDCRGIASKCEMRSILLTLLTDRAAPGGCLGGVGPATFKPVDVFLAEVETQAPRTNIIPSGSDLVAFADVHGDFLALLTHLHFAQVIDTTGKWVGGNRWVCSTGDWVDRAGRGEFTVDTSHNPREEVDILQYIHALNLSAQEQGGGVLFTLGNHELNRVRAAEINAAGEGHHIGDQHQGWGDINKLWRPGGEMALYLARNCPAIARYHTTLLMHGGLESSFVKEKSQLGDMKGKSTPIDMLANMSGVLYLLGKKPYNENGLLHHVTTTRALSYGDCPTFDVDETLRKTGASQLVVGHTVQKAGDSPDVCGGKVWRLDFGMSEAFGVQGAVHVLILKRMGQEGCFLSSYSQFNGERNETRRDTCITYVDGKIVSRECQMLDRQLKKEERDVLAAK
jgi:hypothetical protein